MSGLEQLPITDMVSAMGHIAACIPLPISTQACTGFWVGVMLASFSLPVVIGLVIVLWLRRERQRALQAERAAIDKGYVNAIEIDELKTPWGDMPPEHIERNLANPKA